MFERGLVEGRNSSFLPGDVGGGIAATRLFRSLILIITAIFNGILAFLLLALNLRDLESMPLTASRRWLFFSTVGLLGANAMAVLVTWSAHDSYLWRVNERDSYEKPFTHYMIVSVFIFCMVSMNTLYIRTVYLPFVQRRVTGWDFVRRNIRSIIELGRRERGETSICEDVYSFTF